MLWQCPSCNMKATVPDNMARVACTCGYKETFKTPPPAQLLPVKQYVRYAPPQRIKSGPAAWRALHQYPFIIKEWDASKAETWYRNLWLPMVPSGSCGCLNNWKKYTQASPPVFTSADEFFRWSVDAHNHVSIHHANKPAIPYEQAIEIWSNRDPTDTTQRLTE